MVNYNTWYKSKDFYSRQYFFYNYFFEPIDDKIDYYSIAINHPEIGYDFTFVKDEELDDCISDIIEKFDFIKVDEKYIIKDCFK